MLIRNVMVVRFLRLGTMLYSFALLFSLFVPFSPLFSRSSSISQLSSLQLVPYFINQQSQDFICGSRFTLERLEQWAGVASKK